VEPAVVRLRLGSGLGILVVTLEQSGRANDDLALLRDFDLHPGQRRAHGVGFHRAVRLHAHVHRRLRLPVELLEVHADGSIERKEIGPNRLAGGIADADAAHPEDVPQWPVYEHIADPIQRSIDAPNRLFAVEDLRAGAPREVHEVAIHLALHPTRVLHADGHLRE